MTTDDVPAIPEGGEVDIGQQLDAIAPSTRRRIIEKFVLAALGSIPWIGGFLSAAASLRTEQAGIHQDDLRTQWIREHERKIERLRLTLEEVNTRFQSLGPAIDERIQSPEYLGLVRKAFRIWDTAETDEKRRYAANVVVNSAGTRVVSDDIVRLFMDWLNVYHETHFAVIREVFRSPGASRYQIWTTLYGDLPREDSSEADLFRLLIRDLSTGGVIRQARETDYEGRFLKRPRTRRGGSASSTMESAFEDTKPHVLTELGTQFVHYTMSEVVSRLADSGRGVGPGPETETRE